MDGLNAAPYPLRPNKTVGKIAVSDWKSHREIIGTNVLLGIQWMVYISHLLYVALYLVVILL